MSIEKLIIGRQVKCIHTPISYRRKKDFIAGDFGNDLTKEIPLSLNETFKE